MRFLIVLLILSVFTFAGTCSGSSNCTASKNCKYCAQKSVLETESIEDYNSRMNWFAEAKYGMFIHFGLYSHLGGEWKGKPVPWYSEWLQASKNIPRGLLETLGGLLYDE